MSVATRRLSRSAVRYAGSARYGHWSVNSGAPTEAELQLAASRHLASATFNSDRSEFAARLKELDPGVRILAYVCLSSSRDYEPIAAVAGAVPWNDAVANGWLATDTSSNTMQWGGYGGHYQCKVWLTAYQDAYIAHIQALLSQSLWDGIWADNDFWTLQWYNPNLLAGTSSQAETDQMIRDGLDVLVSRAGPAAKAYGKVLMPNYSEGRTSVARQAQHAAYGGGICEEQFASWGTGGEPTLHDWGAGSWPDQVTTIRDGEANTAFTSMAAGDTRTALYGYTSFLMRAESGDGWSAMPSDNVQGVLPWQPFQDTAIGVPLGAAIAQGSVWTRQFEHAFVAVNPTLSSQTVTKPDTSTVSMGALTGLIVSL